MQKKEIKNQAKQFLDYFSRLKGGNINDAFRFWAEGKDFDRETERAIRREVDLVLKQRGED